MNLQRNRQIITGKVTDEDWLRFFTKVFLIDFYIMDNSGWSWNASDRGGCYRECIDHYINHKTKKADFWDINKDYTDDLDKRTAHKDFFDEGLNSDLSYMREKHAVFTLGEAKKEYVQQVLASGEYEYGDRS